MSEPKKRSRRISQVDFFKLCEEIRNQRETIVKEDHSIKVLIRRLQPKFPESDLSPSSVREALHAVGVSLEREKVSPANQFKGNITRIVASSLLKLYNKLGEPPPDELVKLVEHFTGVVQTLNLPPIPVRSVPPAQTIPVVTPNTKPNKRV